jgi:dipeptidyl aminopeptidase/acylaminoacyl peptidase
MARPLSPADVFDFRSAADAQVSPDGRMLCHLLTTRRRDTDSRHTVLMLATDRRSFREVAESAGCLAARWSPDGARIAFLRGGAAPSLSVLDVASGAVRVLVHSATALRELAWSPDGTRIAFQQREVAAPPAWIGLMTPGAGESWAPPPLHTNRLMFRHDTVGEWPEGAFQTCIVGADGALPASTLTSGPWWHGMPHVTTPGLCFTPDGAALLLTGTQAADWDRAPSKIAIQRIDVATGAVTQLAAAPGMAVAPHPSPDGQWLAYLATDDRRLSHKPRRLFVMPLAGGPARALLPDLDRSIDSLAWDGDSKSLVLCYDDPGRRVLARVRLEDSALSVLRQDVTSPSIEMPYSGGGFSLADDGTLAYVRGATDLPGEVTVVTPNGDVQTATALNTELAAAVGGFRQAEMLWSAGAEGRQVQSWLLLPDGAGPHPLVLEIHGGPFAQYGDRFSMKHQMMAAAGYAVLAVNPCGSTGYGEEFANALHDRFPGPDHDDMMAVLDVVTARPEIDAENVFITGVSGGGVLTLWGVAHSTRFRAGVSIKPVVNWESWLLTADMGPTGGPVWLGDTLPWQDPAKYRARSPLAHVEAITTPTLLLSGEADSRTPPTEALQMYLALKLRGVETALLRFPGTSHSSGVMRPSLFAAEVSATIGWFERFRLRR